MRQSKPDPVGEAAEKLSRYLGEIHPEAAYERYSPMKLMVRRAVPAPLRPAARRLRPAARRAATGLLIARERRRATRLGHRTPLLLHLGCGMETKAGWVNIDLFGPPRLDLVWNLRRRLPFEDDSVDAIFHEHLLEHFTLDDGLSLTRDCHRVLRPGGMLRIGVPDTSAYARSYLEKGSGIIASVRPGRPTPLLAMQEVFYEHGHRTMYDFEMLRLLCNAAGFSRVECRRSGDTRLAPIPDSEHRRLETLYVETVK